MSVEIKYNGNTLATVPVDKGALLKCEGMVMKDNITVINGEGTTVSIIDRSVPREIARLLEEQTATLKCAGKKMSGLIAIAVSAYDPNTPKTVATFGFGANGSASHSDGTRYTVTDVSYDADAENDYTLNLTNMSYVYYASYDGKGNSCIKLGTSKNKGSFEFTVPDDVTKAIIYVAKYRGYSTKISVNGGDTITLTNSSNDGVYTPIEVDTSSNKTVTFTTMSGGYRVMIDKIEYIAPSSSSDSKPTAVEIKQGDNKTPPDLMVNDKTYYGFASDQTVYQVEAMATTDNWDKRIVLSVNPEKNYVTVDFALEFELYGSIYVWSVNEGGQTVLLAKIAPEGGIVEGAGNVVIKDTNGNVVTNEMLACYKIYTMYVSYDGASEICIGCDDYDEEFGGNILYFANAVNGKEN